MLEHLCIDMHDCQMAQRLIAHIETVMCQDVSQQTEIPLHMTCGARPADKKNSNGFRAYEPLVASHFSPEHGPSRWPLLSMTKQHNDCNLVSHFVTHLGCQSG